MGDNVAVTLPIRLGETQLAPKKALWGGRIAPSRSMFAIVAAAGMLVAHGAQAADFTPQECKVIAGIAGDVVKTLGPETLTARFRGTLLGFIAPERGKGVSCDGPAIEVTTDADVAAWTTMRMMLAAGDNPIDLQARGVKPMLVPSSAAVGADEPE